MAVYLTGICLDSAYRDTFESAYRATEKRLDLETFVERVKQLTAGRGAKS